MVVRLAQASFKRQSSRSILKQQVFEDSKDDTYYAVKVQRAFRAKRFMYRHLGPLLFCRKGGAPASFGSVTFGSGQDSKPYLAVSDSTSSDLLTTFMLVRHAETSQTLSALHCQWPLYQTLD